MGNKKVSPKVGSIILSLFSIPFIIVGISSYVFGYLGQLKFEEESKSWPRVEAGLSKLEYSKEEEKLGNPSLIFEFK